MQVRHAFLMLVLAPLVGCGAPLASVCPTGWNFWPCGSSVAAGVVSGTVQYGGEPAGGIPLALTGSSTLKTVTDANGRYTFKGVTGQVQVSYLSEADQDGVMPNEIRQWASPVLDLSSGGQAVPVFDIAYNGLLYPDIGVALVVSDTSLVPFHWSVQPQAQRYRVHVESADHSTFTWASDWDSQPTAVFGKTVSPGSYDWYVEIDAGDAGVGLSRRRNVDF